MTGRYVVTRPFPGSNVGSNLASLAGAVLLAQTLNRALIIDWRGMAQLQDKSINYFSEFFESRPTILGVPVLYAPVENVEYGAESDAPWLSANEAGWAIRGQTDHTEERCIVLQEYHGPDRLFIGSEADRFAYLRRFYCEIAPASELLNAIDSWAWEHFAGRFIVGVNVRTGNGAYFAPGQSYAGRVDLTVLEEGERLLRAVEGAADRFARRLPRSVRDATVTFYATDSQPMSELLSRLPHSITRRRTYPPPGTGDLHAFDGAPGQDRASIVDTLADMFLLARCDALIYNNSLFNQYARVLNAFYGGNQKHIDTLFWRNRFRSLAASARRRLKGEPS